MSGGAVIRCYDCTREFHVSCAYRVGHKFGFEMTPVSIFQSAGRLLANARFLKVKNSRKDPSVITSFKGDMGCMTAIVSCKEHKGLHNSMYELCDINEHGEVCNSSIADLALGFCKLPRISAYLTPSRRHCRCTVKHTSKQP